MRFFIQYQYNPGGQWYALSGEFHPSYPWQDKAGAMKQARRMAENFPSISFRLIQADEPATTTREEISA
jgi:hypothetical protein